MIRKWITRWREWRRRNEEAQKFKSHKRVRVIGSWKNGIRIECLDCGQDKRLWRNQWCHATRLTQPYDIAHNTIGTD